MQVCHLKKETKDGDSGEVQTHSSYQYCVSVEAIKP